MEEYSHDKNIESFKKRMMTELNWTKEQFNDWAYSILKNSYDNEFIDKFLHKKQGFWSKIFGLKKQ